MYPPLFSSNICFVHDYVLACWTMCHVFLCLNRARHARITSTSKSNKVLSSPVLCTLYLCSVYVYILVQFHVPTINSNLLISRSLFGSFSCEIARHYVLAGALFSYRQLFTVFVPKSANVKTNTMEIFAPSNVLRTTCHAANKRE